MIGIYAPDLVFLHDLSCRAGGGSQRDKASMPPGAVPAQDKGREILEATEFLQGDA